MKKVFGCKAGATSSLGIDGFTLAEVLITLGIIGVVAALTIPTLITNYKKKEYSVRLKRFYSTMLQAQQLSEIDNADSETWEYPKRHDIEDTEFWWNSYFKPYFKTIIKTGECEIYSIPCFEVYFQDGSLVKILSNTAAIEFIFDVNGNSSPNTEAYDMFRFLLTRHDGKFLPFAWTADIGDLNNKHDPDTAFTTNMYDRNNVINICKKEKHFCVQLLFLDNWEFKDDYPYKI